MRAYVATVVSLFALLGSVIPACSDGEGGGVAGNDESEINQKKCGGNKGKKCGDHEYCDFGPSSSCGVADQMGTCKKRPTTCPVSAAGCPAPEDQLCGCNGEPYCSECDAHKAGTDVSGETGTCGEAPVSSGTGGGGEPSN